MAPNLSVRSESWLNLSADQFDKRRSINTKSLNYYPNDKNQLDEGRTTSVRGVNCCRNKSFGNNNEFNCPQDPELERLSTSRASLQYSRTTGKNNEHLLIRLRQQSYQLNRSNSTLASSNLSNSVDMEFDKPLSVTLSEVDEESQGLRGNKKINNINNDIQQKKSHEHNQFEFSNRRHQLPSRSLSTSFSAIDPIIEQQVNGATSAQQIDRNVSMASQQQHSTRLMKENSRLSRLRDRLERKSTRRKQQNNHQQSTVSSPLARSWSSLSEQLSDKLSDFRHSWKHFLYQYSQMSSQERGSRRSSDGSGRGKAIISTSMSTSRINCFNSTQTDEDDDDDSSSQVGDMFPLSSSFEQSLGEGDNHESHDQRFSARSDSITPTSQLTHHQDFYNINQQQMIDKSQLTSEWLSRHYSRPNGVVNSNNNRGSKDANGNNGVKSDR